MLEAFYCPTSVAVIGASSDETKLGHAVLKNVLECGYEGEIYAINPKGGEILGVQAYPSIRDVPGNVDLAVIVVPERFVASVLEECGEKGVNGVVVITAGFREVGGEGLKKEKELVEIVRRYHMRMLGPNCLGVIDTICPLNATFARGMPKRGEIAMMSQSGALLLAIHDWAIGEGVGFSRFVSLGNKADIDETDLLQLWDDDPHTKVIVAYLEGIADGPDFMKIAEHVGTETPIIAIKAGTSEAGARAVSSHTGTLAGSERAYEAAFKQAGITRADSVEELFHYAQAFSEAPPIAGDRIAVVSNAGGAAIMATDALDRASLRLASFQRETIELLQGQLSPGSNALNPVDVRGDADDERYRMALDTVLRDANVDGVIAILIPQALTKVEETAQVIVDVCNKHDKPVLSCFMGKNLAEIGLEILRDAKIPNYSYPEPAVDAMRAMVERWRWLQRPAREIERFEVQREQAQQVLAAVREQERLKVGDAESRQILQAYGIAIPRSELARDPDHAVAIAEEIGYPVVMKIASPDILHKTDIGGVKLNLMSAGDVRDAFDLLMYRANRYMPQAEVWGALVQEMVPQGKEVLIGINRDPQFGPLLVLGLGGIYVEILKDVSFRIAPIARWEAKEMIDELRSSPLLRGQRGESPSDLDAIVDCTLRVSQLAMDFPEIVELDINPLMVQEEGKGAVALDMRLVLS
ncbi:MAG TPA: acetate--CoA ligase family protein [Anaerolineae bacterium]|nr:acetate--CoA ligase family protein [Anaerolineae bacterium]